MKAEILPDIPRTFTETVQQVQSLVLERIEREVKDKQLYYHTAVHSFQVQERAKIIFAVINSDGSNLDPQTVQRQSLLLDLAAIAHDMVQVFIEPVHPHTSRRRETGVSERATVEELISYITQINERIEHHNGDKQAQFTPEDIFIIEEAILATICAYSPFEGAIYQPALDNAPSLLARIIALADIGTLGIKGIADYNQEGSLLFLEENPDIIPLIAQSALTTSEQDNPTLYENIRQRLLRRARFQVNFAKSRLKRCLKELVGFPYDLISQIQQDIFPHLTITTIETIEKITPTADDTSLKQLSDFFDFEQILGIVNSD